MYMAFTVMSRFYLDNRLTDRGAKLRRRYDFSMITHEIDYTFILFGIVAYYGAIFISTIHVFLLKSLRGNLVSHARNNVLVYELPYARHAFLVIKSRTNF